MPIKLFSLSGVPDDEANEIRELLYKNNIKYYETPKANWGGGLDALWLDDDTQLEKATILLSQYQEKRKQISQEEYKKKIEGAVVETVTQRLKKNPKLFVFTLIVFLILLLSLIFGSSHRI